MPTHTISKGALVVVAGGTGYIGAAVSRQLLEDGYKVRATTRSISGAKVIKETFDNDFAGKFELVEVPEWSAKGAYDDSLKGAEGFIIVAGDVSLGTDVEDIIKTTTEGTRRTLESAAATPTVKRVVLTSSTVASHNNRENDNRTMTDKTWNDQSIEIARSLPDDHPFKAGMAYSAGKTAGERAAWDFVTTKQPGFVLNTVLPDMVFGQAVAEKYGSTGSWMRELFHGKTDGYAVAFLTFPKYYNALRDVAKLHVAALVEPDVENERLYSAASRFGINDVLAIFRKHYPSKSFPDDFPDPAITSNLVIENQRSTELLKRRGQSWETLEQALVDTVKTA